MTQQSTAPNNNWWGETPAWAAAVHSPNAGARQVLIEACGALGALDKNGAPLDDTALLRRARSRTHPDHRQGDRRAWDMVVEASMVLGLTARP